MSLDLCHEADREAVFAAVDSDTRLVNGRAGSGNRRLHANTNLS